MDISKILTDYDETMSKANEVLTEPIDESSKFLPSDEAEIATSQSKNLYGEGAPVIRTVGELDEANEYEMNRVLDEDESRKINQAVQQASLGGLASRKLQQDAAISAWNRYFVDTTGYEGGLRLSDLREYQANAEERPNGLSIFGSDAQEYIKSLQDKTDVLDDIRRQLRDAKDRRGFLEGLAKKYVFAFKEAMPGMDEARRADLVNGSIFQPVENEKKFYKFWSDVYNNPEISAVQFRALVYTMLNEVDKAPGTTIEELESVLDSAFRLDTGLASFAGWADVIAVGAGAAGTTAKTVSAASKHGLKGAGIALTKSLLHTTPEGTKDLLRTGSSSIKTAKKWAGDLTDTITRQRFVGDVTGATETAKDLIKTTDVSAPTSLKAKGEVKNLMESIIGDATQAGESPLEDISAKTPLGTEKAYRRAIFSVQRKIQDMIPEKTLEGVERLLLQKTSAFEDAFNKLMRGGTDVSFDDLISASKTGPIIKAIQENDLATDVRGNLIVRFGVPQKFKSPEEAFEFVESLNRKYLAGHEIVPLTDGTYKVDVDMNIQKGFGTLLQESIGGKKTWDKRIKSLFATITGTPDSIRSLDYIKDLNIKTFEDLVKPFMKMTKGLSKKELKDVEEILDASIHTTTWAAPEELLAKGYTPKEVQAYSGLRAINDIGYLIVNNARRTEMHREGVRAIKINEKDFGYGRIISQKSPGEAWKMLVDTDRYVVIGELDAEPIKMSQLLEVSQRGASVAEDSKIFKVFENAKEIKTGKIADQLRDNILSGKYEIIESTMSPSKEISANSVYYIMPTNSITTSELPYFVMSYVPGWRRYFEREAYFIKQARVNDKGIITGINTIMSDPNKSAVEGMWLKIEEIRKMCARQAGLKSAADIRASDEAITAAIQQAHMLNAPFYDAATFKAWAPAAKIDIFNEWNELDLVRHNQVPKSIKFSGSNTILSKDDIAKITKGSPFEAMLSEQEMRVLNRSGSNILNLDFTTAVHVDIDKSLKYLVQDMIDWGVMSRYEEIYAETFGNLFRSSIVPYVKDGSKMTNRELMSLDLVKVMGRAVKESEKEKISRAITAQRNYMSIRSIPSAADQVIGEAVHDIGKWFGAKADALHIPQAIQNGIALPYNLIFSKDATRATRAFASHFLVGTLNINQMIKNFFAPSMYILSAETKNGLIGLSEVIPLTFRLWREGSKDILKLEKALGVDSKTSEILVKNIMKMDTKVRGLLGGAVSPEMNVSTLGKMSMFFFNTADTLNRVLAMDVALRHFGYHTKEITDVIEMGRVGAYADSLYMNMGVRGLNRAQRTELGKNMLQFLGFSMRTFETLCRDEQLTQAQRAKMLITMLLMTGASGFVGTNAYNILAGRSDIVGRTSDDSEAIRVAKEIFELGVPDAFFKEAGYDISIGSWMSPTMIDSFSDFASLGVMDIVKGLPQVSVITKTWDIARDMVNFVRDKYGSGNTEATWSGLLSVLATKRELPPGINRYHAAYLMLKTGMRLTASGALATDDNSYLQAVMTVLGADDIAVQEIYRSQLKRQLDKEDLEAYIKDVQPYANIYNATGDPTAEGLYHLALQDVPEELRRDVFTTTQTNAVKNGGISRLFNEYVESAQHKLKTGKNTLN